MYSFKKILVCLDRSDLDLKLIKAAGVYAELGIAEHIYFITVIKPNQIPKGVNHQFPELEIPLVHELRDEMANSVNKFGPKFSSPVDFEVIAGDPTHEITRYSQQKDIDLIILGKKEYHIGRGVTSRYIVNTAGCSSLFVTANSKLLPQTILLPTDFSKASHLAYQKAIKISHVGKSSVTCLHSYEIPTGYHTTGKTYEEFEEIMLVHAKEDFEEFVNIEGLPTDNVKSVFLLDKHGHPDKLIVEYASAKHYDLVVIGSKGRSALSSILLGSIAAKIVESECEVPVLVVKSKEENLKFLDALMQL